MSRVHPPSRTIFLRHPDILQPLGVFRTEFRAIRVIFRFQDEDDCFQRPRNAKQLNLYNLMYVHIIVNTYEAWKKHGSNERAANIVLLIALFIRYRV